MNVRSLGAVLLGILALADARAQPPPPDALRSPIPRGTLDPGEPVKPLDDALRELEQDRIAAPVLERYQAGDYRAAARLGLPLVESGGGPALRFAVANSLAWTGRYDEAATQYRALFNTPYDARARVGVANVLRWRGQAHLAEPYYQEVLARDPANSDAIGGLALAGRELRPALTVRATHTDDDALRRNEFSLSYRRWTADRRWRMEAGVLGARQTSSFGGWSPHGAFASVWAQGFPFSPQLDAAYYDDDVGGDARFFATVQIQPIAERLKLRAGRVDWGRTAYSAGATADRLTASTLGVAAEAASGLGKLRARLDAFDISDGNEVLDAEALITPAWQPLPWRLSWFGGLYLRDADREDPRYWSPSPAYGLAFVGLEGHWSFERADLSASVRRGFAFTRTAGDSWSAGVSGTVWLQQHLALGFEAWLVDAPRPASYRLHHVGAFVRRLL